MLMIIATRHGVTNAERQGGWSESDESAMVEHVTSELIALEKSQPKGWLGPWISQSNVTVDLLAENGALFCFCRLFALVLTIAVCLFEPPLQHQFILRFHIYFYQCVLKFIYFKRLTTLIGSLRLKKRKSRQFFFF
jgi:hypothetical protein